MCKIVVSTSSISGDLEAAAAATLRHQSRPEIYALILWEMIRFCIPKKLKTRTLGVSLPIMRLLFSEKRKDKNKINSVNWITQPLIGSDCELYGDSYLMSTWENPGILGGGGDCGMW